MRQVGYLLESYEEARSEKYKIHLGGQEIRRRLWKAEVHYLFHKSPVTYYHIPHSHSNPCTPSST